MAELQHITDIETASLELIMAMYKGKSQVEGLIASFARHAQKIEDALWGLGQARYLVQPTTAGQTLDNIGDLVGVGRNGLPDADYRVLIQAKVADNAGDATLPTLLRVVQQLFAATAIFEKSPNSFARSGQTRGAWLALMVGSPGVPQRLYPLITKLVRQAMPAGVELAHLGLFQTTKCLAFAGPQPWVGGLGSVRDATAGAPMASLLTSSGY